MRSSLSFTVHQLMQVILCAAMLIIIQAEADFLSLVSIHCRSSKLFLWMAVFAVSSTSAGELWVRMRHSMCNSHS